MTSPNVGAKHHHLYLASASVSRPIGVENMRMRKTTKTPIDSIDWVGITSRVMTGDIPDEPKSSVDWAVHCVAALVNVYLAEPNSVLSRKLDGLVSALLDSDDEITRGLSMSTRMTMFVPLNTLKKRKEWLLNEQAKTKAANAKVG